MEGNEVTNICDPVEWEQYILSRLPQIEPFRFIEEIIEVSERGIVGKYTFNKDSLGYLGYPPMERIPESILMETMAQIGLAPLNLYLLYREHNSAQPVQFLTECSVKFFMPVFCATTVKVESEKIFYRKKKLKASVKMSNERNEIIALGVLAGIGVERKNNEANIN